MTIQRRDTIEKAVRLILLFSLVGGMLLRAGDTTVSKTVPMPTLLNPTCILVDQSQLYVVEKSTISIFKKSDLTFVKKFGREGEGP
ncbi:MAG: hypothetical protein GY765_02450, partial [bacterium]|nr:hypothetical protein [bacterium]